MNNDYLQHYGVKGMRWGHRRNPKVEAARQKYKTAHKEYSKSFSKAYDKSIAAYSPIKKHREANDKRWDDAFKKAEVSRNAKADYKQAKRERNTQINKTYEKLQKDTSLGEKIFYNNATRRKAAQYIVDNNMSVADARKKANKVAIRNTAIFLGAYGAMSIGNSYLSRR